MKYLNKQENELFDKLMIENYNIPVSILMEEAGRRLAEFLRDNFEPNNQILICCGKGNNGGDGLASARHLLNFGFKVDIFMISEEIKDTPQIFLKINKKLNINIFTKTQNLINNINKYDIIIDGLLGFTFHGTLKNIYSEIIHIINNSNKKIISIDIPSGVDCDMGITNEHVTPDYIFMMGAPKLGCKNINAKQYVCDIGTPHEIYKKLEISDKNIFKKNYIQIIPQY